ncbi:hypothetical protein [Pseudomonas sp. RIT-PI-o]|uniref:hypothetical protein n=1 Tax=Pseudomonas sp. RIT-PI-o TaxID=1690246 RepID=UPI00128F78B0|nr:hypothetical protein [Pseudomonas sp. RIT-PI-o]
MNDFKTALAAGLSKAHQINLNKEEIDRKLEQISTMLYEGTSENVELLFTKNSTHNEVILGYSVQDVYVVLHRDNSKGTKIATIIIDEESGYPVKIESSPYKFVCTNAQEIELAFSEIVQLNTVANAIFSLCNS